MLAPGFAGLRRLDIAFCDRDNFFAEITLPHFQQDCRDRETKQQYRQYKFPTGTNLTAPSRLLRLFGRFALDGIDLDLFFEPACVLASGREINGRGFD